MSNQRNFTKIVVLGLMAIALTILPVTFASAGDLPSVGTIVDNYIKAIGGKDAYSAIENSVQKGNLLIVAMGMSGSMTNYVDGNNSKTIMALEGFGEFLSGVKDGTPWTSNMMQGDMILEGDEAEGALRGLDLQAWLHWQDQYESAETVAEEAVGDATAYKVVFTPSAGDDMTYWFDTDNGLIIQSNGPGLGGPSLSTISDYKDVSGVLVPHQINSEGGQGPVEITFESIEYNTSIDASVFAVPDSIATLMSDSEEGSDDK